MSITPSSVPSGPSAAVLKPSDVVSDAAIPVKGPEFDNPYSLQDFLLSYQKIGFQATSLAKAIDIVNRMVSSLPLSSNII